jgi:hypothetical protein
MAKRKSITKIIEEDIKVSRKQVDKALKKANEIYEKDSHKIQSASKESRYRLNMLIGLNGLGTVLWLYGAAFNSMACVYLGLGLMTINVLYFIYRSLTDHKKNDIIIE